MVDTETGELVNLLDATEARVLTDRIKVGIESIWFLVVEAYERRAWAILGYISWDEYCTREFGSSRLRLPAEEREQVIHSLRDAGLSIRAIASATGTGTRQVQEAIASSTVDDEVCSETTPESEKVTGTDGKKYDAVQRAKERREAEAAKKRGHSHGISVEALVEQIEAMAQEGHTSSQIAAALNLSEGRIRNVIGEYGLKVHADRVVGKARRLDSDRIVAEMVATTDGLAMSVGLVKPADLDPEQLLNWATSLTNSLKTLNRFSKQLKEMTQ